MSIAKHLYIIEPADGWQVFDLFELWSFRDLLSTLIGRNLRIRHKHPFIGFGWVLLKPALAMHIYTLFFGLVIRIETHEVPSTLDVRYRDIRQAVHFLLALKKY